MYMMLDKRSIDMLLALDDATLSRVIARLAKDSGIDPSGIKLGERELSGIRMALAGATDKDIARATELIKSYKKGKDQT